MLRAENHLDRTTLNPPQNHTLSELRQSRRGCDLASILARGILPSRPEYFSCGTGSWPDHVVEVDGVGLLRPDVNFAAEDEVGLFSRDTGKRVVGVYEAPVFGGGAVVGEGVE